MRGNRRPPLASVWGATSDDAVIRFVTEAKLDGDLVRGLIGEFEGVVGIPDHETT